MLAKLNNLRQLDAGGSSVTDKSIANLKILDRLVDLNLSGSKVSDDGLENLEGLSRLESLDLAKTVIGDAGLRHIAGLRKLETLNLSDTKIGNDGLKNLAGLQRLESLFLCDTRIDDAAIPALAKLGRLERLDLRGTDITSAGYWELCAKLPRCCKKAEYAPDWGRITKGNEGFGPEKYAKSHDKREAKVFRLMLLGCMLQEGSDGNVFEASINVSAALTGSRANRRSHEILEIVTLLRELDSITSLRVQNDWAWIRTPLDDSVVSAIATLTKLKNLQFNCPLSDRGCDQIAGLFQLRELRLDRQVNDVQKEKLKKALPNCTFDDDRSAELFK